MPLELKDLTANKIRELEAGRELDALVAQALGCNTRLEDGYLEEWDGIIWKALLKYSTCANAALAALDRLGVYYDHGHFAANSGTAASECVFIAVVTHQWATTFPLAASRAILGWWLAKQEVKA